MPEIVTQLAKFMGGEEKRVCIFTFEKNTNTLNLAAGHAPNQRKDIKEKSDKVKGKQNPVSISVDKGLVGRAFRKKETVYSPDVSQEQDYYKICETTQSELVIPLIYEGQILGVLNIESSQLDDFDPPKIHFIETLARQVATIIDHSILQEQLLKSREQKGAGEVATLVIHYLANMWAFLSDEMEETMGTAQEGVSTDRKLQKMKRFLDKESKIIIEELKVIAEFGFFRAEEVDSKDVIHISLKYIQPQLELTPEVKVQHQKVLAGLPKIKINKDALALVIAELMLNALQFMEKKESKIITLSNEYKDGNILIRVKDTGCGMKEENKERIFDRGRLGLRTCLEILKQYGGSMNIGGEYGKGCMITITLPAISEIKI